MLEWGKPKRMRSRTAGPKCAVLIQCAALRYLSCLLRADHDFGFFLYMQECVYNRQEVETLFMRNQRVTPLKPHHSNVYIQLD